MIAISIALVLVALATLLLGVFGFGDEPLRFVYVSIGACLLAAVFLVAGVLRARPARRGAPAGDVPRATWSGALPPPAEGQTEHGAEASDTHVQVLSAREAAREAVASTGTAPLDLGRTEPAADDDAEHERFVRALEGLDLDPARLERLRGRFVTLERLRAASVTELAEVPGVPGALAERIHARLRAGS